MDGLYKAKAAQTKGHGARFDADDEIYGDAMEKVEGGGMETEGDAHLCRTTASAC